jgi:F-type H+-transporting ATPase subunit a
MEHHQLWFTALLNRYLAGPANAVLNLCGFHAEHPDNPWPNWFAMEILVALILVILFAILRTRLNVTKPGKLQHTFELIYQFVYDQAEDSVGPHQGGQYVAYFGTIFLFILFMNLIGVVPSFESPTMFVYVPAGCAIATFFYYNFHGFRVNGLGYLKHFTGGAPVAMWPLLVPIEIISHLARPLSLTIRLFANMFAGEQVTLAFLSLIPLIIPIPFFGLHIFVGLIQAYIFMLLTMVYIGGAVSHEH